MKTKFVTFEQKPVKDEERPCYDCAYGRGRKHNGFNCGHHTECSGGYFVRVKGKKRPGKHERLLKALLKGADIVIEEGGQSFTNFRLTLKQAHQLSEIKESMK